MARKTVEAEAEVTGKSCSIFLPDNPEIRPTVQFSGIWSMRNVVISSRLMEKELRKYKKELIERGELKKEKSDD